MADLAPGMERIIEAGDTLVIVDSNEQEFAVTAIESEPTMDFIKAFDQWFLLREKNEPVSQGVIDALYAEMKHKYLHLPMRIQRELPSFKSFASSHV